MSLEELFNFPQYTLDKEKKDKYFLPLIIEKLEFHQKRCEKFNNILLSLNFSKESVKSFADLPFLPVRLFKNLTLKSIKDEEIYKILYSSGTTSQNVSKIYLDTTTASHQTKALTSIITSFIGNQRLPMVVVDTKSTLRNKNEFSARAAGILGLSNFGRNHSYILDDKMNIDVNLLKDFVNKNKGKRILFFGFTFMIWQYLIEKLKKEKLYLEIPEGILIHSGGWKKLESLNISDEIFKENIEEFLGIRKVYNFYGMVEQVGAIYMECELGYFHVSNLSEIIIRSQDDLSVLSIGKEGVIQTISVLPTSYP
ncbi:MAG: acyl-protein synthetase, partial [Candidatus Woesearchaeota archaeon]